MPSGSRLDAVISWLVGGEMGFFISRSFMKETFYFSHDFGARNDEKIIKMLSKDGWTAYGLFWAIIEKLYEAEGYLTKDYDSIAFDLRTDSDSIKRIIESYSLFKINGDKFHSKSVLQRLDKRAEKSNKAKQSAEYRWNKPNNANALPTQSDSNAIKESKGKENKGITASEKAEIHENRLAELDKLRVELRTKKLIKQ